MKKVRITESQLKGLVRRMVREEKGLVNEVFPLAGFGFIDEVQKALDERKTLNELVSSVERICDKYRELVNDGYDF